MEWNELVSSATDVIMDTFGVPATYKPQGGFDVETRVSIETEVEVAGERVFVAEDRKRLTCLRKDVGLPSNGDVFTTDGGTDYTVDGYPEDEEAGDEHLVRVIVR